MGMITPTIRNSEGCVFRQKFINDAYITDNNGTLNGASNISSNRGIFRNDWSISYPYSKTFPTVRSGVFSIHLQGLISDIDTHEGAVFGWRADANNRFYIEFPRTTNKQSRVIYNIAGGGVVTVSTPVNSLSNGFHDIVWTFNSATWECYIDGVSVVLTGVTADFAGLQGAGQIVVGSYQPATNNAWIDLITAELFNRVLTQGEIQDLMSGMTFREVDVRQLEFFLPLRTHYNNGVSELTPNLGIVGGDTIKWGDGSIATTFPTLLKNNGASFDGGDYIGVTSALNLDNTQTYSFGGLVKYSSAGSTMLFDFRDGTGKGFGLQARASDFLLYRDGLLTGADGVKDCSDNMWHSVICVLTPSAGQMIYKIYIDGELDVTNTTTAFTNATGANMYMGCDYTIASFFIGSIKFPFLWHIDLSPAQAKWQHEVLFRQINL